MTVDWRGASAIVVEEDVARLLRRYEAFDASERRQFTIVFTYGREHLEGELGDIPTWRERERRKWAVRLTQYSTCDFESLSPDDCGEFLLGCYIEAFALPAAQEELIVSSIEAWHRDAMKRDIEGQGIPPSVR